VIVPFILWLADRKEVKAREQRERIAHVVETYISLARAKNGERTPLDYFIYAGASELKTKDQVLDAIERIRARRYSSPVSPKVLLDGDLTAFLARYHPGTGNDARIWEAAREAFYTQDQLDGIARSLRLPDYLEPTATKALPRPDKSNHMSNRAAKGLK
jgi:hypothetical protein